MKKKKKGGLCSGLISYFDLVKGKQVVEVSGEFRKLSSWSNMYRWKIF